MSKLIAYIISSRHCLKCTIKESKEQAPKVPRIASCLLCPLKEAYPMYFTLPPTHNKRSKE